MSVARGAVFLAAQGISESNRKNVPQELYDKMFEYCFGDNKYLSQKTAMTINCLKGAKINWHIRELEVMRHPKIYGRK